MVRLTISFAGAAMLVGASPGFAQHVDDDIIRRPLYHQEEVVRRPRVLIEKETLREPRIIVEEEIVRRGSGVIIDDDWAVRPPPGLIPSRPEQAMARTVCKEVREHLVQADSTTVTRTVRGCR